VHVPDPQIPATMAISVITTMSMASFFAVFVEPGTSFSLVDMLTANAAADAKWKKSEEQREDS
jgi:hypothetical protein